MRRVIYGVACSLDGFIAGPNGEIDWLYWSKDVEHVMTEFWPRVDTMIMGRKTYEAGLELGGGDGAMPGISLATYEPATPASAGRGKRGARLTASAAS